MYAPDHSTKEKSVKARKKVIDLEEIEDEFTPAVPSNNSYYSRALGERGTRNAPIDLDSEDFQNKTPPRSSATESLNAYCYLIDSNLLAGARAANTNDAMFHNRTNPNLYSMPPSIGCRLQGSTPLHSVTPLPYIGSALQKNARSQHDMINPALSLSNNPRPPWANTAAAWNALLDVSNIAYAAEQQQSCIIQPADRRDPPFRIFLPSLVTTAGGTVPAPPSVNLFEQKHITNKCIPLPRMPRLPNGKTVTEATPWDLLGEDDLSHHEGRALEHWSRRAKVDWEIRMAAERDVEMHNAGVEEHDEEGEQ